MVNRVHLYAYIYIFFTFGYQVSNCRSYYEEL